jgi:phospholipase/lecithinase/hemolysin
MGFNRKCAGSHWLVAGVVVSALMTSCGGGTQVERFVPQRIIALGDETSVINADHTKYTVNALATENDPLGCIANPIWVQVLAGAYGLVFEQCNSAAAPVTGLMLATPNATVGSIGAQAAQIGPLSGTDLVTVLAGANDILAKYALYNTTVDGVVQTEAVLTTELETLGAVLASQVNGLADAGGKVLIATVPDLGLTPFATAQKAANTDTDRAALLSRLTGRFNAKLRANIVNDGRRIGLLLADELVQTVVKFPSFYGYVNVIAPACLDTAVLPTCTTSTLQPASGDVAAAGSFGWLWADALHLSPGGHGQLGNLAASRASGNPF